MFQLGKIQILETTPLSNFGRPSSHVTKLIILCDAQQVGSHRCASGSLTFWFQFCKTTPRTFHDTGCLIGILIMVYYNHHLTSFNCLVTSSLSLYIYLNINNPTNQGPLFSLLSVQNPYDIPVQWLVYRDPYFMVYETPLKYIFQQIPYPKKTTS